MWLSGLRGFDWMPDLWSEIDRMQQEAGYFLSGTGAASGRNFPAINLWMNEHDMIITAEVPGIDPADMDISVEGEMLILNGSRLPENGGDGAKFHRQERPQGGFRRKIRLPYRADSGKAEARYDKGVLTIRLPRLEEDKPKKISIKSE